MEMSDFDDQGILEQIGRRLRRERLNANLTQQELAHQVGLALKTVSNAEDGRNVSLETLIRMLRGLGRLDALDAMLADPALSPIERAARRGQVRQRATGSRKVKDKGNDWQW